MSDTTAIARACLVSSWERRPLVDAALFCPLGRFGHILALFAVASLNFAAFEPPPLPPKETKSSHISQGIVSWEA